jgi:hypothetical protein
MITKLFSILLSGFILVQTLNIQTKDVCKFNELVDHFQYHVNNYGDDVFTFFSKHYGELKDKHRENHEKEDHNQLPFSQNINLNYLTVFILHKIRFAVAEKLIHSQTSNFYYLENYTSIERSDIFQPPKQA